MKQTNFTLPGGFPLEQIVLARIQEAHNDILKAFTGFMAINNVGNQILWGCQIVGANITPGMMYIDGDLCSFAGAVGDGTTKIIKSVVTDSAAFQDGTNPDVFTDTIAIVDAAGAALSTFVRFYPVFDPNYVHTDNNLTPALLTKLNGVMDGAEVNVQSDFTETISTSDSYIRNKPIIPNVLRHSNYIIGDMIGLDEQITISFPSIGTIDYSVFVSLNSLGDWNNDNDIIATIKNKTATSFNILLREVNGFSGIQNLTMDYLIIQKP